MAKLRGRYAVVVRVTVVAALVASLCGTTLAVGCHEGSALRRNYSRKWCCFVFATWIRKLAAIMLQIMEIQAFLVNAICRQITGRQGTREVTALFQSRLPLIVDVDKPDTLYSLVFYRTLLQRLYSAERLINRRSPGWAFLFFHISLKRSAIHVPDIDIRPPAKKREKENVERTSCTADNRRKKRENLEDSQMGDWESCLSLAQILCIKFIDWMNASTVVEIIGGLENCFRGEAWSR
ncbi:hypothetical protein EAG_08430 [Camponotus floridanus]|uniref:Uncharacterized protein n=1 Tax=Camponotus floridanus TaxID=104421 RepID=E1ZYU3_CAMFO|nr:hypothetical protein EAG_08430 [Camponotus floridanus]